MVSWLLQNLINTDRNKILLWILVGIKVVNI